MGDIFLLLVLALVATLSILSTAKVDKQTYVVHVDKSKVPSLYHPLGNYKQWYEEMINSMSEFEQEDENGELESPQILYVYETAVSGFAVKLSAVQLQALSKMDGFLDATPDEILSLHTTYSPNFLGLKSGQGLWNPPSLASDVIVGVLDTGIWPEHVSFHDEGLSAVPSKWKGQCENGTKFSPSNCNKKIIGARSFFKGYETIFGKIDETNEYRSPRDSQGHGTHTASTAAGSLVNNASLFGLANGKAAGMKYTARIAAYKVCWPLGCTNSDLLAAIDQAILDGVDVLSLSIGGTAKPFYNDNIAIASFRASEEGIFVSCSAGNSGPIISSVDNTAPWIMTVAASYIDRSFPAIIKLGNGQIYNGASLYSGRDTKNLQIVYGETAGFNRTAKYCINGSLKKKLVKQKIVLCDRGINGRTAKGEQVKLAGGAGMLLVNSEGQGDELFADAHVLPATTLGASVGIAIKKYINSTKNPTASISFKGTTYGNPAPAIAAFSSRGPSSVGPDVIKPDVTAPGVNILAAWPPITSPSLLKTDKRRVLFNIISGTSMSCPHVSGLAALLKSVHRNWSAAAIKSALMTTAYVINNKNAPISDLGANNSASATPFAFGSGHVDPEKASDPGLIYDITTEDYLNFLCSLNYTSSQITQVSRRTFSCPKHTILQPGDLNYPSFAVNFEGKSKKVSKTFARTVTNVGVSSSYYTVKVEQPDGVSITVEPKILRFRKMGEKLSYKVRFLGLQGRVKPGSSAFGSLVWESGKYKVRSPIAVTWR